MLKVAFPLSPSPQSKKVKHESIYQFIVRGEQKFFLDVIRQARKLSFMIQQFVSCQMLITVADLTRICSDGDILLSTYSFGLQKNLGGDRTILIRLRDYRVQSYDLFYFSNTSYCTGFL